MVVDSIKCYKQLAEHCKQATTETLTTETTICNCSPNHN